MSADAPLLIVDDDEMLRGLVRGLLEREGHRVLEAGDGRAGLRAVFEHKPALVLLDASMPELDGYALLDRIREVSDVPVLMLTAHGEQADKVRALRGGADDHVTKPYQPEELVARVEALLRRAGGRAGGAGAGPGREAYDDGRVRVDLERHEAKVDGRVLPLTPQELKLLGVLTAHRGQILTHDQLLEAAWGGTIGTSAEQVRLYVSYLRRKLVDAGLDPGVLETARGFGYRWRGAV